VGKTEFELFIARSIVLHGIVNYRKRLNCNFVGYFTLVYL